MTFISILHTLSGRFSRNSAKWLTPTGESIHYFWDRPGGYWEPDQPGNWGSNPHAFLVELRCVGGHYVVSKCYIVSAMFRAKPNVDDKW